MSDHINSLDASGSEAAVAAVQHQPDSSTYADSSSSSFSSLLIDNRPSALLNREHQDNTSSNCDYKNRNSSTKLATSSSVRASSSSLESAAESSDSDSSGALSSLDCSINTSTLKSSAVIDTDLNNNNTRSNGTRSEKVRPIQNSNFSSDNVLASRHQSYTRNTPSLLTSFFYANSVTVLNKLVMSYEEQLLKAIEKGNYELCNELLLKNCNVNAPVNKKYPLCVACEQNYYDICELLIKHGANVNQFDYFDQSCLIYAVGSADLNVIQLLVKNGASLNRCDSNGFYPLHIAVTRQNDEICDYLLEQECNIDCVDKQGYTPLSMAITSDYFYMIEKLLRLGADPNLADTNGDTPLIKAIWSTMSSQVDHEQILKVVKLLVQRGADVNAKNETGRTALFTAIYQNNTDIALFLIENGARCELEDPIMRNFTLLHYACFQGNFVLAKALLEKKCDPNAIATSCESPVYIAVIKGYLDIVSLLVEHGANVNLFIGSDCDNKCTALQAAVYYISDFARFRNIVDKLIEGNADLSIAQPGPIIFNCLQYNKVDFAKYLVSVGSNIEQRTVFNQSCFYKAFLTKNLEFMQLCIMAGFDLYDEPWISEYIENPDFIEYTDYYVKRAIRANPDLASENSSSDNSDTEITELMTKSNQEISDLLDLDEYFFERFHLNNHKQRSDQKRNAELARKIYALVKYYYTNPKSLKELSRIKIRQQLLKQDYKMKFKVEKDLPLPKSLKEYLLLREFNI